VAVFYPKTRRRKKTLTQFGLQRGIEVDDARVFFSGDRPDSLTEPMLRFWNELSKA
jgi:hypothetical protein